MGKKKDTNSLAGHSYWVKKEWIQPPVKIKHGDFVEIEYGPRGGNLAFGRYIGKGMGVAIINDGVYIGKVKHRGLDRNPPTVSDEILFSLIED